MDGSSFTVATHTTKLDVDDAACPYTDRFVRVFCGMYRLIETHGCPDLSLKFGMIDDVFVV
jgi:hypothetical protein